MKMMTYLYHGKQLGVVVLKAMSYKDRQQNCCYLLVMMRMKMLMLMMSVMVKLTTCSDVPERVEDRQVKLADKVKRFSFALFHLMTKYFGRVSISPAQLLSPPG